MEFIKIRNIRNLMRIYCFGMNLRLTSVIIFAVMVSDSCPDSLSGRADARKTLHFAECARSREPRKSNSWTVGEIFEGAKVVSVAVVIVVSVDRWFCLVLQECWQSNSQQRWSHKSWRCVVSPWRIFDKSGLGAFG